MKKIKYVYLIFLLSIGIWMLNGQSYPLLEEGKMWNILENEYVPWNPLPSSKTRTVSCMGDSTIEGVTYKKWYFSYEENPVNWTFFALVREDSSTKVWLRDMNNHTDKLVYDFSLTTGDSVMFWSIRDIDHQYMVVVDSVSEIMINETPRKKIWLFNCFYPITFEQETWIEGIGSNLGVIYPGLIGIVGGWYELLCVSHNETLIYETDLAHNYGCYYYFYPQNSVTEIEQQKILIYPNPTRDVVRFEWFQPESGSVSVKIFNVMGQLINSVSQPNAISGKQHLELQLKEQPNGIYYYRIEIENQAINGKIVKM